MNTRTVLGVTMASAFVIAVAASRVALTAPPTTQSQVGQWSPVIQMPIVPIHVHLLPNGQLLLWRHGHDELTDSSGEKFVADHPTPHVWDPNAPLSSNNPRLVDVPTLFANGQHSDEIYCSGHTFLPDGRLMVFGGHLSKWNTPSGKRNSEFTGSPQTVFFDHTKAQPWSLGPFMNGGRWYPTGLPLPDGTILVSAGLIDAHPDTGAGAVANPNFEIYDPVANAFRTLTGAAWPSIPSYAWMYRAPNGGAGTRAFYAGPGPDTRFLHLSGEGQWGGPINTTFGQSRSPGFVHRGTSVLYAPGKILNAGGIQSCCTDEFSAPTTAAAEVIDLNAASPAWRQVASMTWPRQHLNSTLLPNGQVLVTGGTMGPGLSDIRGSVMAAEIWDPNNNSWSVVASQAEPRLHHSVALLLPDGRVLFGGGGETGGDGEIPHTTFEIYSPPYLFKGSRPVIGSGTPAIIRYGQPFSIQTNDRINKVVLIRLPSVTHGFNQNQGVVEPSFTKSKTALRISAMNPDAAPPGHYMLFIVTNNGVPSVAKIVQVTN